MLFNHQCWLEILNSHIVSSYKNHSFLLIIRLSCFIISNFSTIMTVYLNINNNLNFCKDCKDDFSFLPFLEKDLLVFRK